ncbi:MAG TPA: CPCC family cysteine-rich protein [Chitinophagales bacterium]|nr:CPCC family cysteine-rich protein [Chitinophagales bacterium]
MKKPNQDWFNFYVKELEGAQQQTFKAFDKYFLCPCCYLPTLTERQGWNICLMCYWEDDGQDDHNADKVLGGPNHDYSLTEARANFCQYLISYRPSDSPGFENGIKKAELKKQVIEKYNLAMTATTIKERKKLLKEASALLRAIYK